MTRAYITEDSEEARRAELEALFRQWEQSTPEGDGGDTRTQAPVSPGAIRLRFVTTIILLIITGFVMVSTRSSVAYWVQSETPVDLGDLRAKWVGGQHVLGVDGNLHVQVSGLIPSRLIAVTTEGDEKDVKGDEDVEYVFFCPLFNITVLTSQPIEIPGYRMPEIDAEMQAVVERGLAFPADTLVRFEGKGRLLKGTDAPPSLRRFVNTYAKRLELDVANTWVFLDGRAPSSETAGVIIWGLAAVPPLVSLAFLIRALRRQRRR
jgi:hypothetical protein